jgi:hypothetical protein
MDFKGYKNNLWNTTPIKALKILTKKKQRSTKKLRYKRIKYHGQVVSNPNINLGGPGFKPQPTRLTILTEVFNGFLQEVHTRFWWGNLRKSIHLEGLGTDGRILKWIFM